MCLNPLRILMAISGVNNQKIFFAVYFINQNIVNNAAALVAHRAVTYLPVIHVFKIVAEQILHVVKRISAFN